MRHAMQNKTLFLTVNGKTLLLESFRARLCFERAEMKAKDKISRISFYKMSTHIRKQLKHEKRRDI